MNLKKINPNLQKALNEIGLLEANDLQESSWSSLKSGADCVLISPAQSGKTVTLAMAAIQKLSRPEGESTRALLLVKDKEAVHETVALLRQLAQYTELRIYGVHEKGDVDFDKNHISLGLDILVATPVKADSLFSGAGFNLNTVKFLAVDDADVVFKNRHDHQVQRLIESAAKTQKVFLAQTATEKLELMADKLMTEPLFFEPDAFEEDEA